ncbi:hypothetical protein KC973_02580 [Candidatus Saccharibacteria bacterium]|nr:hypothetical protein [Candidatus Saccharibacteria bacterium]
MKLPKNLNEFRQLKLVVEGESKEIRYIGQGKVAILLKPTIYSYTHNRCSEIPGSDVLRLKTTQLIAEELKKHGVKHAYTEFTDQFIIADLVLAPEPGAFRPDDLSETELAKLPIAPPIEVVVKSRHVGTPKHRYYQFERYPLRSDHPAFDSLQIKPEDSYPETVVRFDWRNPMHDEDGNRLADEVLSEQMADWFINVKQATITATRAYEVIRAQLARKGIDLWDICFFVSQDGTTLFGEISQDCGRYRLFEGATSLDKDVWRAGGSAPHVLKKWEQFYQLLR